MYVKVKFLESFKDGNIFGDRGFSAGEVAVLNETQVEQTRNSGGVFEVLEKLIANPLKAEKYEKEPNDPLNPQNEINDLETHVPGMREEVEEVKARDAARKKNKK